MKTEIPDKLYFKIGEVAKLAEVPSHVLRYWESEFPGIRPKRANSKQRLYRRQDVEQILAIKSLLHEQGYTIAGARKLMDGGGERPPQDGADGQASTSTTDQTQKLQAIKQALRELQDLLKPGKNKLPDGRCC
jgi:DNA-binding transcriptional MerR regulator